MHTGLAAGWVRQKAPARAIDHVVHRWQVFLQPGADPINPPRGNLPQLAGADHHDGPPSPISQPTRRKRAKYSRRSAATVTLSAGLVIRVAISRARVTCCGARIRRRSATSDFGVVVEKRRAVPTFSRLTAAPQYG
jgi:hypothetical protein